ncbi:sulfur carrier protein ThiS [Helicobacter jaachi]|uniref:Sulfur carrier protein ThiS n=1 Tax=Helicobacter jaachi TaxID=1677920 RepID=A0A4U8TBL1_9HELI|nr:sulfur carrier protein ThiS [Helicobacter jaachi]TLD97320.1 sulfur carrier protein ThiS [Helicobacter jaachi]
MASVLLNGKDYEIAPNSTILSLIEGLEITHKAMAIAVNTQVVQKSQWALFVLQNGDEVEILDFVGGG